MDQPEHNDALSGSSVGADQYVPIHGYPGIKNFQSHFPDFDVDFRDLPVNVDFTKIFLELKILEKVDI